MSPTFMRFALSPLRARFFPFPSPSDACHAGYGKMSSELEFSKKKEVYNKRLVLSFVNNDSPIKR